MRSGGVVALAMVAILVSGCEKSPAPTYPATGRATFEGEPVKGATITFVPEQGRPATAITDDDGEFEMSTFKPGDGAVAGRHTVTIILTNPGDEMIIAGRPSKNAIPGKYTVPETTPFKVEVSPDKENRFELKMTKDEK